MLATLPVVARPVLPAGQLWRQAVRHPVIISGLATAVGAAIWILLVPRIGTDLPAALARAAWASQYPDSAYLFSWYGGISPASYSVLAPYLLAAVGTHLAMAIAAVLSAMLLSWLFVRHEIPRPALSGLWVAAALWTELSAGRAAFTLGLAAALGCVVAIDVGRKRSWPRLLIAGSLALTACLLSPVAALFLGVVAGVLALGKHWVEVAVIAVPTALPLGIMAMFSDGGVQPIGWNWIPALLAAASVLLFVPRRWPMVRSGAIIYGLGIVATCLLPTPIGSNVVRLGELLIGPILIGMGSGRPRWLLALGLTGAALWQIAQPATDLAHVASTATPATALLRELRVLHADTARVEAVPQYDHWESQELASAVPLARGWERQVDVERNPLFYNGSLTAAAYHQWLRVNAVRYVAISTAAPDQAAVAEAAIVRAAPSWLVPVWHDASWQLYRLTDSYPLADPPATVTATTPAVITLQMSTAGTTIVRVYWSRHMRAQGAIVSQDGLWTRVTVRSAGVYALSAPY